MKLNKDLLSVLDSKLKVSPNEVSITPTVPFDPPTWKAQLDRLQRWYERIGPNRARQSGSVDPEIYRDDVYAFFQNCHHLKDWLIKDPSFRRSNEVESYIKKKVESYINNDSNLRLCADLCNGSKHFVLDKSPRSGASRCLDSRIETTTLTAHECSQTIRLIVESDSGESKDAYELATACLESWKSFIGSQPS